MVQFYDPTDLFGDLAEALAEQFPDVAPELDGDDEGRPRPESLAARSDAAGSPRA